MAITQEVVALVSDRVAEAQVRRVVLEIGRLSGVLPDAIRFCFDLCAEGTPLGGAELEIVEVPGLAECRVCAASVTLERPFGTCACGSTDLEWKAGDELKIKRIEVR
jgi:hydrogenase nickel incorporation protein HypA/HybF